MTEAHFEPKSNSKACALNHQAIIKIEVENFVLEGWIYASLFHLQPLAFSSLKYFSWITETSN